jgi:ankyrin repeat protein
LFGLNIAFLLDKEQTMMQPDLVFHFAHNDLSNKTGVLPRLKHEPETLEEILQTKCLNKLQQCDTIEYETIVELAAKHGMERYFYYANTRHVLHIDTCTIYLACCGLNHVIDYWKQRGITINNESLYYGYCMSGRSQNINSIDQSNSNWYHVKVRQKIMGVAYALLGGHVQLAQHLINHEPWLIHHFTHCDYLKCIEYALKGKDKTCIDYALQLHHNICSNCAKMDDILDFACKYDSIPTIEFALKHGANLTAYSMTNAITHRNKQVIDYIMNKSPQCLANPFRLYWDSHIDMVKYLYEKYSNHMNIDDLCTPASERGCKKIISYIVSLNVVPSSKWVEGFVAAAGNGRFDVIKILLTSNFIGNVLVINEAFIKACKNGYAHVAEYLLDHGANDYKQGLLYTCSSIEKHQHFALVERLLFQCKQNNLLL